MPARYIYTAQRTEGPPQKVMAKTKAELAKRCGINDYDINNGHAYTGRKWPFEYVGWKFYREIAPPKGRIKPQDKGRKLIESGKASKAEVAAALEVSPSMITRFVNGTRNLADDKYLTLLTIFS